MKNIILSIGKVEPGLTKACKRISKELDRELECILLVDISYKNTPSFQADPTGYFKEIVCDFNNPAEIQRILKPLFNNVLAVQCRSESAVQDYRRLVPFLPYTPTPNESTLEWATVKSLMRERLEGYDSDLVPKFIEVKPNDLESLEKLVETFEFPLIVKPSGLNSSMLVTKCDDVIKLKKALKNTFTVIDDVYSRERGSGRPQILVEEFMSGDMYSTDAYISPEGKIYCLPPVRVITSHDVGLSGFYGYEFQIPTELTNDELDTFYEATRKSIYALNLRSCTAHVELYNCSGEWKIIELGPRIGGHREDLYRESYGTDHYYNDLASRIAGMQPDMPSKLVNYSICMDLYPEHEGFIESFEGLEEARMLKTCVFAEEHTTIGTPFYSAENGSPYAASALFSGSDKAQVTLDAARAREIIKIRTKPF